jgi:putative hydrolase of HD superfamily
VQWTAGIKDPETIAEHSFRTAILATILAALEGVDPARAAQLALFTTRKRRASTTSPTSAAAT